MAEAPLLLKQRLRKREREEQENAVSTSLETGPRVKRQKDRATSPCTGPTCSLKTCAKTINSYDCVRVEVKAGLPEGDEFLSRCSVEWSRSGEAAFHADCWDSVQRSARTRSRRLVGEMSREEKAVVREAAKTAEWHDSDMTVDLEAHRIASLLRASTYCIAFTGAGISTSAGIGDYRGKDGKWTEMDRTAVQSKVTKDTEEDKEEKALSEEEEEEEGGEGVPYENLRPTYTHEALVQLMEMGFLKHVISQNGDGLHGLSGIPPDNLSELHGNVFLEICERCGHRYYRPSYVMDDTASTYYEEIEELGSTTIKKPKHAQKCKFCGLSHRTGRRCEQANCKGYLKDSIINFGDNLEEEILTNAEIHARKADLCLSLGTTMQVTPACELVKMGQQPLRLVIVNRQKTDLDDLACNHLPPPNKDQPGARVYGDTDRLMRALMKELMPEPELLAWESERDERMKKYNCMRTQVS